MSNQRFNMFQRRAFWEKHKKKCSYCCTPVAFRDFEIDHIIPEKLSSSPTERQQTLCSCGLPSTFDIFGLENLTVACTTCNAQKLGNILPSGTIAIQVAKATSLSHDILELISSYKFMAKNDTSISKIATELEKGVLSDEDLSSVISFYQISNGMFNVRPESNLFAENENVKVSISNFDYFMNKKVPLPDEGHGLRLISDDEKEIHVFTLSEYMDAIKQGYYPLTTSEMSCAFQFFEKPLTVLSLLQKATHSHTSHIDSPYYGVADISLIPAAALFSTSEITSDPVFSDDKIMLQGKTIQDLIASGDALVSRVATHEILIEYEGMFTYFTELFRADVTGDGIVDLVIHRGGGPIDGTYRSASIWVFEKTSSTSLFSCSPAETFLIDKLAEHSVAV